MPSQTARLHQLTVNAQLTRLAPLFPLAFSWQSQINQPDCAYILTYTLNLLTQDNCSSLIGTEVCLSTLTATHATTERTGIITAINYQHSDGALHFYELEVVSPDWLLTQSVTTRSFVDQSTLDILTSVLSPYPFNWQVSEQLLTLEQLHASLPLRTQAGVSDWEFVTGLLADIGVSTVWVAGHAADEGMGQLGAWWLVVGG